MERKNLLKWIILVIVITSLYAFFRYNIFKGVLFIHIPLYIVNKIAACSGLILISLSLLVKAVSIRHLDADDWDRRSSLAGRYGNTGFFFILVHLVISLSILSHHYYPKFYIAGQAGKMNLIGEFSLLFGILSLGSLVILSLHFSPINTAASKASQNLLGMPAHPESIYRVGILIYLFAALHVSVMGYSGWFTPAKWPGSMPPMTLLAFIAAMVPLLILLISGKFKRNSHEKR